MRMTRFNRYLAYKFAVISFSTQIQMALETYAYQILHVFVVL